MPPNKLAKLIHQPADELPGKELAVEIEAQAPEGPAPKGGDDDNGLPFLEDSMEDAPARARYIDYLKSPVVGLLVGQGDEQALLTAHQALLITSPWFADACAKFSDEVSVGSAFSMWRGWRCDWDMADEKRNAVSTS
jgi:hypothetical protein